NNAACVGRTLWSRERDREPVDRIAGVTDQLSWLGRTRSRSLGEWVQDVDRPAHIQSLPEPARTPRPRGDTQALRVVRLVERLDGIRWHHGRRRHLGQRVAVRSPELEGAVG